MLRLSIQFSGSTFRLKTFLSNVAPQQKIVGNRPVRFFILVVYRGRPGIFNAVAALLIVFSKIRFCLRVVLSSQIEEPIKKSGALLL